MNNKRCENCKKYPFCEKQGQVCEDWEKQPYCTIEKDKRTGILRIRRIN